MYKIQIVELLENDTKYPTENKVYEQKIPNLDVEKVALFLNTKHNFQKLPSNKGKLTPEDLKKQRDYIEQIRTSQEPDTNDPSQYPADGNDMYDYR